MGSALSQAIVGRGAAYGDYDNDGDLDLLVTANNGPARLIRNDGGNQNNLLRIKAVGTASNRDGIGAKITLKLASGMKLSSMVKTGSSYASQSEMPVTLGLGKTDRVAKLEIIWPSGRVEVVSDVEANQAITVEEAKASSPPSPLPLPNPSKLAFGADALTGGLIQAASRPASFRRGRSA